MTILNCDGVSLSFGAKDILQNITFAVEEGDKLGIIGVNGAGKTSLLNIITGRQEEYTGSVRIAKNAVSGVLKQAFTPEDEETVAYEYVKTAYADVEEIEKKIADVEKKLESLELSHDDDHLNQIQKLVDSHEKYLSEFEGRGGYGYENRIKSSFNALGFKEEDYNKKLKFLSGGQKTRVGLLRLFLSEPDILFLDEPTNHIDADSIEWLEDFLKSYRKTVIMISHDRYFLDGVTNKILEIENLGAKMYGGNFSQYVVKKENDREVLRHQYEMQQREIKRIEAIIEQQRRWGREKNIRTAESKQKQIDRMEKIEKPENLPAHIKLSFGGKKDRFYESGNDVLTVKGLSKSFPGKKLFQNLSFEVKKRDYFFIIGENGTGKSSLLKIITNNLKADGGSFEWGYNVDIGYYDQENQHLNEEKTVISELWDEFEDMNQTELRNNLASFLFRGDDIEKKVNTLSGGERARLTLLKLILRKPNLLILDEPTNHLDINSREALEKALVSFKGTVISVSHDRYFIKKLSTRILELEKDGYLDYKLGYEDFINYKNKKKAGISEVKEPDNSAKKADAKKITAESKKSERQTAALENEIRRNEEKLQNLRDSLYSDEIGSDYVKAQEISGEIEELEQFISGLYEKYEQMN